MDGDTLYSIGDLARRTGLTVKAIRLYSDRGIVPPTDRSPAGYRRYGIDAVARLELVRTLRELGLDLSTIRKVVDREISLAEVAATHADALAVQIRMLRVRRAVLTVVAKRGSTPQEMDLMHKLATLSSNERQRLIGEFLDAAFGGESTKPGFAGVMRSMTPELPDDAGMEQVEAWVQLAELSQDRDFRASMRRLVEQHVADRVESGDTVPRRDAVAVVRDHAGPALAAGIDPGSPQADAVVVAVMAHYADVSGLADNVALRRRLLTRLETANDPRRELYEQHLSVINGWPAPDSLTPALNWFIEALHARIPA
jgi:DNA-binding transcriptional MerR regulator